MEKKKIQKIFFVYEITVSERCSGTRLLRRLPNLFFHSRESQKYISYEAHLFWKYSKLNVNLENGKKIRKYSSFLR